MISFNLAAIVLLSVSYSNIGYLLVNAQDIPLYGQCGGLPKGDNAWGKCANGSNCQRSSDHYWQCLPAGGAPGTAPTSGPTSAPSPATGGSTTPPPANGSPNSAPSGDPKSAPMGEKKMAVTTRYFDCCKPSCSWPDKAELSNPVQVCGKNNEVLKDPLAKSGCEGGEAFTCADQGPSISPDDPNVSYGYAAAGFKGFTEKDWCGACYELTFPKEEKLKGKKMIVQVTNTGTDLTQGDNHFDLAIPGGGQGIFTGCSNQFPNFSGGERYGGINSLDGCAKLPDQMRKGCEWRFGWFMNADNPAVEFQRVKCPPAITKITNSVRKDEL